MSLNSFFPFMKQSRVLTGSIKAEELKSVILLQNFLSIGEGIHIELRSRNSHTKVQVNRFNHIEGMPVNSYECSAAPAQ